MRAEFAQSIEKVAKKNKKIIFFTGDLGYNALERVRDAIKERFINAGVAEQNMMDVAAGMAYAGFTPWVYSIPPFLILKTVEQIRNDICQKNLPVRLVGMGGGYAYGILASTHHILEDIAILSSFPNIKLFIPAYSTDVDFMVRKMDKYKGPSYLRLSLSPIKSKTYAPLRKVKSGNKLTILVLGPMLSNVLEAALQFEGKIDVWVLTEIPFNAYPEFYASIKKTRKLLVIEEHGLRGGIAELMSFQLQKKDLIYKMINVFSKGYPSKLYGSQKFHLKDNGMDPASLKKIIKKTINE